MFFKLNTFWFLTLGEWIIVSPSSVALSSKLWTPDEDFVMARDDDEADPFTSLAPGVGSTTVEVGCGGGGEFGISTPKSLITYSRNPPTW